MNYYEMWFNLRDSSKDLEFSRNLAGFLTHLQSAGKIEGFRLRRRKLGFGPDGLGEFSATVWTRDLAQLDTAFQQVAPRKGETEQHHARVWSMVTDFKAALYRDFPDPERTGTS